MSTFKTVEQMQAEISSQAAQLERLREAAEDGLEALMIARNRILNWRGSTSPAREEAIANLRAALQAGEGAA